MNKIGISVVSLEGVLSLNLIESINFLLVLRGELFGQALEWLLDVLVLEGRSFKELKTD